MSSFYEFIVRNWALVSIIATVVIVFAIAALVLGRYIRIMLNIMRDTPPPFSIVPLDYKRLEGKIVRFRALDGISLRGMFLSKREWVYSNDNDYNGNTKGNFDNGNGSDSKKGINREYKGGFSKELGQSAFAKDNTSSDYKGMIIFCHEYASDMYSCARYCKALLDAGFDIFTFDYRGHGQSSCDEGYTPRQWVSDREISDTLGAIAFVEDYLESQGRPVEIGMFGISRGAAAAVISSAKNPAIKAIITDGLFSTDITIEGLMKKWAYIFAKVRFVYENHPPVFWRFLRWLMLIFAHRKFHCYYPSVKKAICHMLARPVLMIHGEKDNYIPVEQAKRLYELLPTDCKELWIVPGAKHNQAVTVMPEEYARKTVEFFERYLVTNGSSLTDNIPLKEEIGA